MPQRLLVRPVSQRMLLLHENWSAIISIIEIWSKELNLYFIQTALVSFNEDGELDKPADIYAVGFQEIVDLNAGNIVAAR